MRPAGGGAGGDLAQPQAAPGLRVEGDDHRRERYQHGADPGWQGQPRRMSQSALALGQACVYDPGKVEAARPVARCGDDAIARGLEEEHA